MDALTLFTKAWCLPQGHQHDDAEAQLGCILVVRVALKGGVHDVTEQFLAAVRSVA